MTKEIQIFTILKKNISNQLIGKRSLDGALLKENMLKTKKEGWYLENSIA